MGSARAYIITFVLLLSIWSIIIIIFSISEPKFYIHQLHVREDSINSSNPNSNTSIFMDLEFKRRITITPLRYNDVNITLSCASTYVTRRGYLRGFYDAVGYGVVPGFDTGKKKTVHREAVVVARGPLWHDTLRKIADGSTVYVEVEVIPKHMKTAAAGKAVLLIDRFGKVSKKPIALYSGVSDLVGFLSILPSLVVLLVMLLLLLFVCVWSFFMSL